MTSTTVLAAPVELAAVDDDRHRRRASAAAAAAAVGGVGSPWRFAEVVAIGPTAAATGPDEVVVGAADAERARRPPSARRG